MTKSRQTPPGSRRGGLSHDRELSQPMFYVYALIDPRSGNPFYIGKGKGSRIEHHERDAARGVFGRKCETIRQIWSEGLAVRRDIVSWHEDENQAFAAEARLIEGIGLDNLTNVLPGGLIGADVYLERVRQREEAAAAARRKELRDGLEGLAPKLARALRLKAETGGFGMMVEGKWLELSGPVDAFIATLSAGIGLEEVNRAIKPYGVSLVVDQAA